VLQLADAKGLRTGKTVAVDATTPEANAALKAVRRQDTGADWKAYLTLPAAEAGIQDPTDEAPRRFGRQRKNKKGSNDEGASPTDPGSRSAEMKGGTTHLAYKAAHGVGRGSDLVLAAGVDHAEQTESSTWLDGVATAQINLTCRY
jgi:hypothetical protein